MLPTKIAEQKNLLLKALRALDRLEEIEGHYQRFRKMNIGLSVKQIKKEEIIEYADAVTELSKGLLEELTGSNVIGSWNVVIAAEQFYQN